MFSCYCTAATWNSITFSWLFYGSFSSSTSVSWLERWVRVRVIGLLFVIYISPAIHPTPDIRGYHVIIFVYFFLSSMYRIIYCLWTVITEEHNFWNLLAGLTPMSCTDESNHSEHDISDDSINYRFCWCIFIFTVSTTRIIKLCCRVCVAFNFVWGARFPVLFTCSSEDSTWRIWFWDLSCVIWHACFLARSVHEEQGQY